MMKKIFSALVVATLGLYANDTLIKLYESPTCGCCKLWAKYMQKNGYTLEIHESNDFYTIKDKLGIKPEYQSCHTALIQGYAIEGHVPSSVVAWLVQNKPKDVIGVSAPMMPQGSPGMEQGYEETYPVLILKKDGSAEVYGYFKGENLVQKN
ncbi:DUF411 domain-containing protein [Helicobacter fennelliae]|nr:DUF411 domain-containing protein [Helicobacter fennelliae]